MGLLKKLILIIPSSIIFFLVVPIFTILFGKRLDSILKLRPFNLGLLSYILPVFFLLVGSYYVLESIRILLIQGQGVPLGDVIPNEQTMELVTTGIYGQTRNPMLFGYLLCLSSIGILMGSYSIALILPVTYIVLWTIWLKKVEEPALEIRFGEAYRDYKKTTPFLIPRPHRRSFTKIIGRVKLRE
jgi:protein-S-isoprenylcysteine O-methyltransferase Ste14